MTWYEPPCSAVDARGVQCSLPAGHEGQHQEPEGAVPEPSTSTRVVAWILIAVLAIAALWFLGLLPRLVVFVGL